MIDTKELTLNILADFYRGVIFDKADESRTEFPNSIPVLRSGNIQLELDTANDLIYIPSNIPSKEQIFRKGDIAICISSGSAHLVGKIAPLKTDFTGTIGGFCGIIRPKNELFGKFLKVWLKGPEFKQFRSADASGSNIQNLQFSNLPKITIQLPKDLEKYESILDETADKLSAVEQMRQLSLQQKEAVEALQQKQLDEILSLDKFKNLKFKKLKDYHAEISAGKAVSSVGGYYTTFGVPYLQVNNIDNERGFIPNKIVYISEESHKALNKSEILKEDVLINIVGPPIGKICWYPNEEPANINQAVVRVRCPKEINFKFLTYLLRTSHFYNHFVEVKVGSRQWNVSSKNIGDLLIPEIPIDKQLELVKEIESKNINQLKLQIFKQLEAIEALPAAILREVFEFKTNQE